MSEATRSEDYSSTYYDAAHLGGYDDYSWDNPRWRGFFEVVADRVVALAAPRTVLDVGCARGLLVQALAARGVDAVGTDISSHAVETAHPDVRPRLRVASAAEAFEGRYDLVTCIEVLEHLSPLEAQQAIDHIAAGTDRVLFSSSPADHDEATHVNTHPTTQWVAWFAERGFFRRTDVDVSFLSPWAVLLERADLSPQDVARRYEVELEALRTELVGKRAALLESHRRITSLHDDLASATSGPLAEQAAQVERWQGEVLQARHQLLTQRDHVIGTEAEVATLRGEVARLRGELTRVRKQVRNLRGRLEEARGRAQQATRAQRRLGAELAAVRARPSLARRVVRKLRGAAR